MWLLGEFVKNESCWWLILGFSRRVFSIFTFQKIFYPLWCTSILIVMVWLGNDVGNDLCSAGLVLFQAQSSPVFSSLCTHALLFSTRQNTRICHQTCVFSSHIVTTRPNVYFQWFFSCSCFNFVFSLAAHWTFFSQVSNPWDSGYIMETQGWTEQDSKTQLHYLGLVPVLEFFLLLLKSCLKELWIGHTQAIV